mmetsp:Transcript_24144/g.75765  ORF Transcript_24144/g.75765 Transcript_24144/m.75765 type:complete len:199 (-) Transcript_24144:375-971(-)
MATVFRFIHHYLCVPMHLSPPTPPLRVHWVAFRATDPSSTGSLLNSYEETRGWPGNYKTKNISIMDKKLAEARARVARDQELCLGIAGARAAHRYNQEKKAFKAMTRYEVIQTEYLGHADRWDERVYGPKPVRHSVLPEHAYGQEHKDMDTKTNLGGTNLKDVRAETNPSPFQRKSIADYMIHNQGDYMTGNEPKMVI